MNNLLGIGQQAVAGATSRAPDQYIVGPDGSRQYYNAPSAAQASDADVQYRYLLLQQLRDHQQLLQPLERLGMEQFAGPQAEQNRRQLLQTVDNNVMQAFGRAGNRQAEDNRRFGTQRPTDDPRNQIAQQAARAQASTDTKRASHSIMDAFL